MSALKTCNKIRAAVYTKTAEIYLSYPPKWGTAGMALMEAVEKTPFATDFKYRSEWLVEFIVIFFGKDEFFGKLRLRDEWLRSDRKTQAMAFLFMAAIYDYIADNESYD